MSGGRNWSSTRDARGSGDPEEDNMTVYLDNAASSHPKPESVYLAVNEVLRTLGANPGRASHALALKAGQQIARTRQLLAKLFTVQDPNRIVFTYRSRSFHRPILASDIPICLELSRL
jgi:selenocysteine lyase/cysteine desulfurase